ncbi:MULTISPECIES: bactofilin family protein [Methyloversatilis]|jgi:cytoskeletal protein CcmA (bactofilin family)|uniref:bactofilin family protein n=1 Tax=Methyloversatilis TaxID=378210 RepID=UPI000374C6C4|nr:MULTISPECIES: polymer-forming cytoskeletal protein [Methyloversatilis]MCR6665029.1 polymer-forming cytoskeletal protein [Methyloversatilis sp.]
MFNKPGLFPKSTESTLPRTIRPGGGGTSGSGMTVSTTPSPAALSPQRDTPAPQPSKPEAMEPSPTHGSRLIVGPDVKLRGAEILDCDTLVVEGRVEATMDSRVIRIAENGAYSGTVSIDVAEIHGNFDGELTAREQLIVHATGRVSGKIRYGKIHIEEGGEISGDIKSLASAGKEKPVERKADEPRSLTALAG